MGHWTHEAHEFNSCFVDFEIKVLKLDWLKDLIFKFASSGLFQMDLNNSS